MSVLTSSGVLMPRNVVYGELPLIKPKKRKACKKKRHTLPIQKPKHVIGERQAQFIMDRQIAKKLRKMFY